MDSFKKYYRKHCFSFSSVPGLIILKHPVLTFDLNSNMVSKVGEKETCAALDERWGKDGNNFVAALLDDVGRGRVLRSASAEVALRNEDIQTGGLHPLNNVHAEILEMKSSLKLCQIGNATE